MDKVLFTVGISKEEPISQTLIQKLGATCRAIIPFIENRNVEILTQVINKDSVSCAEIMKQILLPRTELGTFTYQGNSGDILTYPDWKEFLLEKFKEKDMIVVVTKDSKIYYPNPIKSLYCTNIFRTGTLTEFFPHQSRNF